MFDDLGKLLCTITGFDSFSLQPNAGAAGEYAGLMVIRAYHKVQHFPPLKIWLISCNQIVFEGSPANNAHDISPKACCTGKG